MLHKNRKKQDRKGKIGLFKKNRTKCKKNRKNRRSVRPESKSVISCKASHHSDHIECIHQISSILIYGNHQIAQFCYAKILIKTTLDLKIQHFNDAVTAVHSIETSAKLLCTVQNKFTKQVKISISLRSMFSHKDKLLLKSSLSLPQHSAYAGNILPHGFFVHPLNI